MYAPPQHRMEDRAAQLAFMRRHAFATLVSAGPAGAPQASHLPLVVAEQGGALRLLGHQARANPQWRELAAGTEVLAVFQGPPATRCPEGWVRERAEWPRRSVCTAGVRGPSRTHCFASTVSGPHAYISPSLYQRQPGVPTWNYAVVHAYGRLRLLDGRQDKLASLRALAQDLDAPWLAELERLPPEFLAARLDGIVAFEIAVSRVEARWKLSQERTPVERGHIAAFLQASGDSAANAAGAMTAALDP